MNEGRGTGMTPPMVPLPPSREVVRFTAVAGAYFLISLLGLAFVVQPEQLSVFWPGGGLALGYLLVIDRRHWPTVLAAIFAGNAAGNLAHGHTLAVSSGFAVVNAVEPFACAGLLTLVRPGRIRLDRTGDVGWLFVVPGVVCAVTALGGAGLVAVGLGAPSYWGVWKVWWLADALGTILFAPLVLTWTATVRSDSSRRGPILQAGILLAALAAIVWAVFVSDLRRQYPPLALPYPIFLLLLFVTLRSGVRGTTVAVAVTALITVWGTIHGAGPVSSLDLPAADRVLVTQGFAAVVCLSSLILATAIQERREREAEVVELNRVLAERVREAERAATALRESEERFDLAVRGSQDGIWDWHIQTEAVYFSPQWKAMLGYADSEVESSFGEWERLVHADDLPRAKAALAAYLDGAAESYSLEVRMWHKDGATRWILARGVVVRNAAGRPARMAGSHTDVTDRRAVTEQLRLSEARFKSLAANAPVGIYETDAVGNCLFVNARWCWKAGLTPDEAAGTGWVTAVHPDDRDRVAAEWYVAAEAQTEFVSDYRFRTPDGRVTWLSGRAVGIRVEAGRVHGYIGTVMNVTARLEAEAKLRASEERFRAAMEGSLHAVYFLAAERGPDGAVTDFRFTDMNGRGAALIARPREEVLGRRLCDLIPVNRTDGFFDRYVKVFETGEPLEEEFLIAGADGIRAAWLHHQVVRVGDGVVVTSQDITDRKSAEAALQESEARFRGAFEDAAVGMALVGLDGRWLRVNSSLCEIVGYGEAELLATDFRALTHPDDWDAGRDHIRQSLVGSLTTFQVEKRYVHKGGHVVWVQLAASLVRGGDGTPLYFVAQLQDISDRKRGEMQLREVNEVLQTLTQVQTDFLVTASPKQSFDGLLSVLLRMTGSDYGFIGQVLRDQSGNPYLKTRAITDISWDDATRRFYAEGAPSGLAFTNLDTLFGAVLTSGRPVIANRPATDPRRGGLPPGHPPLNAFLGIPFFHGSELIGMVGVANRTGGYQEGLIDTLAPVLSTCASLVKAYQLQTERESAEAALRASLHEKEVMLREIHHRVKNNLAVIASLFHLQSGYTTDEPILRLLREAQHRVRSMAMVHEHLYNSADLGAVNFAEYTRSLVEQLFRSYRLPDSTVRLALDIRPATLSIDQAVPCGLILNELVSNGLKHAFPDRGGTLSVALLADGEVCELRVSDDGVGLPPDRLEGKPRSLGLRLIRTLARQLNGTVEFRPATPGTEVRLAFPILNKGPGANA